MADDHETQGERSAAPVLDLSAVRQLEADTQSHAFVANLVETYVRMLDQRVERIVAAVVDGDADRALDAALSLRVSSIMTGTTELAALATGVVDRLRAGDLAGAQTRAGRLPDAAERARAALVAFLGERGAAGSEAGPVAQDSADSIR